MPGTGTSAKSPIVTESCVAARLGAQLFDHRGGDVDAVDADPASRERQRDPTGADGELQGGARTRQLLEERDGRDLIAALDVAVLSATSSPKLMTGS